MFDWIKLSKMSAIDFFSRPYNGDCIEILIAMKQIITTKIEMLTKIENRLDLEKEQDLE